MKKYVIIVAGGKGNRFKSEIPKQFVNLNNLPILMQSINCFYNYDQNIEIIVVLPEDQFDFWNSLCIKYNFLINHSLVKGGEQRFFSVKNGLSLIKPGSIVGIHDAVRPLVDAQTIKTCYETAMHSGNAIPVTDLVDSIRKKNDDGSSYMENREKFCLIQTPQVFKSDIIIEAFQQDFNPGFTDDASVLEAIKPGTINLVKGNRQNIKITTHEDLIYAETIINSRLHNQ